MTDLIAQHRKKPWPPLIVDAEVSRLVRWRDLVLTLLMWALLAWMLEAQLELLFGRWLERWGFGEFDTDLKYPVGWLRPYFRVALILLAVLAVASVRTLIRRRRGLALPPPPPLTVAEQAARCGMDEHDLAAARELPNVVVTIDKDGRHSVKAR